MNNVTPLRRPRTPLGVVIVTFNSEDVIGDCLDSLLATISPALQIVVCDNASGDDTIGVVRAGVARHGLRLDSDGARPADSGHRVMLLRNSCNLGFAAAVNIGLARLSRDPTVGLFWILNPDCLVLPGTAAAYLRAARKTGRFGLMGGRTLYLAPHGQIQSDGGRIGRWTGVCRNANQGRDPNLAQPPRADSLDYLSGANLVASRAFLDHAGPMPEGYFLYYEEVDWAQRRGGLALVTCPEAVVLHHGGTAIGSGIPGRLPSAFSNYFNYRNRMRFMCRHRPVALPTVWGHAMAKIGQLCWRGAWDSAAAAFRGLNGLAPPAAVRRRLSPEAHTRAFGAPRVNADRPILTE